MTGEEDLTQPVRELTDESLRTEREKADAALAQGQAALELEADRAARRARQRTDEILNAARETTDEQLDSLRPATMAREIVAEERAREDQALSAERAVAEQRLRRERAAHALALAKLLPLEREKTDGYLLTERARADQAIFNRDQFLSMVSHDLRNLLHGVALGADLVCMEAEDLAGGTESVTHLAAQRIKRAATQMNRLLSDLVDVSSIEAGKLALAARPGQATGLITEAVETFQLVAVAKGLSLTAGEVPPSLPAIFDKDRILQVLGNLISNAIKFSGAGGQIQVSGVQIGDEVRLSVSDTGPGIPAAQLEAVFERFWQVAENDQRGMGLGLYISRSIVEAHGGKIWAESTLGAGSTFHFTLPGVTAA